MEICVLKIAIVFCLSACVCSTSEIPELRYINASVDPCENFYEYTCGNFKTVEPRPADEPLWDHFVILQKELNELFKLILSEPNTHDDLVALKKAKAAYSACLEVDFADQLRVIPEVAILEETQGWPMIAREPCTEKLVWSDIANIAAKHGLPFFFDITVQPNLFDATQNWIVISTEKLSKEIASSGIRPQFPDNIENFLASPKSKQRHVDSPYFTYVYNIALHLRNKIGSYRPLNLIKNDIKAVIEFMGKFHNATEESGFLGMKTVASLQTWTDEAVGKEININWLDYLNNVFKKSGVKITSETLLMIQNEKVLSGILKLISQSSNDLLLNYVMTRLFTQTAQDSIGELRAAYDQFRRDMGDKVFSRDDYCIQYTLGYSDSIALSMAVTHEYQLHHFNVNKLQEANKMVINLMASFTELVKDSHWLDEPTQVEALKKADKMITLLGYPKFVEDPEMVNKYYENLRVCAWDHFGNSQRLKAFRMASNFALLGSSEFKKVWPISPLTVDAKFNNQNNRILFPVSMLNGVFFNGSNNALDYGRIGAVIGHEITHGFDNNGKNFDGDGSLVGDWWSNETSVKFSNLSACFVNQYSEYFIPEINRKVNGRTSLGENIADNGGLREAYLAFKKLKDEQLLTEPVEGYSQDQLFFIGYGTMWCALESEEFLNKLQDGPYPPSRYRVIGAVSNNIKFSEAFNCPVGSKMNPVDKCVLW